MELYFYCGLFKTYAWVLCFYIYIIVFVWGIYNSKHDGNNYNDNNNDNYYNNGNKITIAVIIIIRSNYISLYFHSAKKMKALSCFQRIWNAAPDICFYIFSW